MNFLKATAAPWAIPSPRGLTVMEQIEGKPTGHYELNPKIWRPGEFIVDLPITRDFVSAVLKEVAVRFVASPGQKQRLLELSAEYKEIENQLTYYNPTAVNTRYIASTDTMVGADSADKTQFQTRDVMQREASMRRVGLYKQLGLVTAEATQIARDILEGLQKQTEAFASRREKQERKEAESFGIEFQPSALLVTAWQSSWRLVLELPDPVLCHSPKQILKCVPVDL